MSSLCVVFTEERSLSHVDMAKELRCKYSLPEYRYRKLLTSFAYNHVLKQIELAGKVKLVQDDGENVAETSAGILSVTSNSCECSFWKGMYLPCRHIFACRRAREIDLFDGALCIQRWTMDYYKQNQCTLGSRSSFLSVFQVSTVASDTPKVLSQHEKYHLITSKLASLASETTMGEFNQRYEVFLELMSFWESGKVAHVLESSVLEVATEGIIYTYFIYWPREEMV